MNAANINLFLLTDVGQLLVQLYRESERERKREREEREQEREGGRKIRRVTKRENINLYYAGHTSIHSFSKLYRKKKIEI